MDGFLYFVRWQLIPVVLSLPAHIRFVLRGFRGARTSPASRLKLAWASVAIHLRVRCSHNPAEILHVMNEIVELGPDVPGVIVECGAFRGGSSAKLSRAVALVGRELIVCDSFQGLPAVAPANHVGDKPFFAEGQYAGTFNEVQQNVTRLGVARCVRFVPGWYEESLSRVAGTPIACAFWDVDLKESFRTCIVSLWPDVVPGAKVFLHDIDRVPVVDIFSDQAWWRSALRVPPPTFVGAHTGLDRHSPLLGYVCKTAGGLKES